MMVQARAQSAQSPQGQVAVEGRARQPQAIGPPAQLLMQLRRCRDHRAADHITVTIQILGRGVHDDIGAQRQWLLPQR